jgi:hypothetical protein
LFRAFAEAVFLDEDKHGDVKADLLQLLASIFNVRMYLRIEQFEKILEAYSTIDAQEYISHLNKQSVDPIVQSLNNFILD